MGEMRDSDWSRENLLRSDWLLLNGAPITTAEEEEEIEEEQEEEKEEGVSDRYVRSFK